MNKHQKKIDKIFKENFGYTPLSERLKDIQREFFELTNWKDVSNLKEESGDLLCSLIQLHTESGWDVEENITATLDKIKSRSLQYKSLGRKTKIAIFGGAFDPITEGHIKTAQFVLNTSSEFDEVWLMPAYKHMHGKKMASSEHRLKMCELASKVDGRIKVFDYEIKNKLAGETFNLFKRLFLDKELNNQYHFSMIIGQDNANNFHEWVNFKELERMVRFVVVPRAGVKRDLKVDWYLKEPHIFLNKETNILEVSSTDVRDAIKFDDSDLRLYEWLNQAVFNYILDNNLYL